MLPWVQLDAAMVPGGGGELRLMQRGGEFSIMAGAIALMNSRMSGSEVALAQLACERLRDRRRCRILIGGYGMGFTLRAALAGLDAHAEMVLDQPKARTLSDSAGRRSAGLRLRHCNRLAERRRFIVVACQPAPSGIVCVSPRQRAGA
jgi:hypothetical protein